MKKVLFPILGLVLALGLALPMSAPTASANGSTVTQYIDTSWDKTTNYLVESTFAVTALGCQDGYWSWISTVWDGPGTNASGDPFVLPAADYWAKWTHEGVNWTYFTHRWFKTELNICGPLLAEDVKLVDKYNHDILSINDDLYVYVNGVMVASGGTAGVAGIHTALGSPTLPAGFVACEDPYDYNVAPGTGWYIDGGLVLPKASFVPGANTICILAEEFAAGGGLAQPVFEVTYWDVSLGDVTPAEGYNPVCTNHTVSVDIGIDVADIEVSFEISGPNASASGTAPTDGEGIAEFTYQGCNPGVDTITAYIDCNGNGEYDDGELSSTSTATKYWLEPFVTGGANIKDGNKVIWTFGGNVGLLGDGTVDVVGQFQIVDHANKVAYHCHNDFSSLVFSGTEALAESPPAHWDTATFTGTFSGNDGSSKVVTVTIKDLGEPGAGVDRISLAGGLVLLEGFISGGNFQVHE